MSRTGGSPARFSENSNYSGKCPSYMVLSSPYSPILSIPGINYRMGAMIIAEIGDFSPFGSPDKILTYAVLSPSTYRSEQPDSSYSHMEKRNSRYLRYALFNATEFVCIWEPTFKPILQKSVQKENITMSPFHMLQRNWCELFIS